jgi:hypothetical protein
MGEMLRSELKIIERIIPQTKEKKKKKRKMMRLSMAYKGE